MSRVEKGEVAPPVNVLARDYSWPKNESWEAAASIASSNEKGRCVGSDVIHGRSIAPGGEGLPMIFHLGW